MPDTKENRNPISMRRNFFFKRAITVPAICIMGSRGSPGKCMGNRWGGGQWKNNPNAIQLGDLEDALELEPQPPQDGNFKYFELGEKM